jgi:hypothetical protein
LQGKDLRLYMVHILAWAKVKKALRLSLVHVIEYADQTVWTLRA